MAAQLRFSDLILKFLSTFLHDFIKILGMSLPYSSSSPADSKEKRDECVQAGEAIKLLLEKDIKPRDIMTKAAFENAIRMVMMTGGSTNAVLHLIAMSRSCQDPAVAISLDDFQRISDVVSSTKFTKATRWFGLWLRDCSYLLTMFPLSRFVAVLLKTPFLADLKPSGKYVMEDVQNIGGTPGMIKFLIDNGMFDGDQMTVTGKTHNENLKDLNHPGLTPGQEIIRPLSDPIKATGHLQIMYGNLCPGGGVAKITGKEGETFTVCFDFKSLLKDQDSVDMLRVDDFPCRYSSFSLSSLRRHRFTCVFCRVRLVCTTMNSS